MILGIVILAAGAGTRMKSCLPKVLHALAGKPMLQHVLDTALALNPHTSVIVYGHGGEILPQTFANFQIKWAKQEQQLGTAHAVQQAIPYLTRVQQILILYGDVPLITAATLHKLIAITTEQQLNIITVHLSNPTGYGRIIRDAAGQIIKIVEQKDATAEELAITEVNTGIILAPASNLITWLNRVDNNNQQQEFYLTDVIEMAVSDGIKVNSVQTQDIYEVIGINDRVQLAFLERHKQMQQAQELMRNGVTLTDPARFDLRGTLRTGIDVVIDINVIIEGNVILGSNVKIGANCILRDCQIGDNSIVYANTIIENSTIASEARIGPYARIRPGSCIAEKVHIGNFVEVKNTKLGAGSKANHLSYLGDAELGERVNIGAGTITCNYDGEHKHQTKIGNQVFIGSNTSLVAPVTVGDQAIIGAGSVITKNAPANELTLSRAEQRTVEGWVAKNK